ncbi:hypothetical protein [Hymenobacter sp. BT190]|uniref:hypothetical protein n=1 Tax=Hymenobacter sp. BT190 TaxID=2763505 RepID=UPI001650D854|nr:hypothetical protein [Hymenobacter sp. BT190]MBC6698229.1 hypothetical protein [Hymenobacter sp. BT190]
MILIRTLLLTIVFLLANRLSYSQPGFSKGSCVLRNGQQLHGNFNLRTATAQSPAILVYYDGQAEQEFEPTQVRHLSLGRRSYIIGGNFVAPDDKDGIPVDHDFVEVIDTTGGVQLFRYEYVGYSSSSRASYSMPMGNGPGNMMYGGGGDGYRRTDILLLRAGTGQPLVPYMPGSRDSIGSSEEGNASLQEKPVSTAVGATTAFFVNDPELQKRIESGKLSEARLEAAVRAYNAGVRLQPKN